MQFTTALTAIATQIGGDPLTPDASGAVALGFGEVVVNLRPDLDASGFVLDARLGPVAPESIGLLREMMIANRWPTACGTGVLSLDLAAVAYLVQRVDDPALSRTALWSLITRFAARAIEWHKRVVAAPASTVSDQGSVHPRLCGVFA